MGAFLGSIYSRGASRAAVASALANIAGTRFLVGPERRRWISIYPSRAGQDTRISAAIATHVRSTIVHLLVHDGDVFRYTIYREGALVDEYSSRPDYFAPVTPTTRAALRGKPEKYADLLVNGVSVREVRALLDSASREEPAPAGIAARARDMNANIDHLRNSPEMRELEHQLRDWAIPFLKGQAQTLSIADLGVALTMHSDPEARRMFNTYQHRLTRLMEHFGLTEAATGLSASDAADDFARMLGLPDAIATYEDLAANLEAPFVRAMRLIRIG